MLHGSGDEAVGEAGETAEEVGLGGCEGGLEGGGEEVEGCVDDAYLGDFSISFVLGEVKGWARGEGSKGVYLRKPRLL